MGRGRVCCLVSLEIEVSAGDGILRERAGRTCMTCCDFLIYGLMLCVEVGS